MQYTTATYVQMQQNMKHTQGYYDWSLPRPPAAAFADWPLQQQHDDVDAFQFRAKEMQCTHPAHLHMQQTMKHTVRRDVFGVATEGW